MYKIFLLDSLSLLQMSVTVSCSGEEYHGDSHSKSLLFCAVCLHYLNVWRNIFCFHFAEWKKIQSSAHDHFQRILNDHEKLKLQLESQKEELKLRGEELEKREARNETERKKLSEEISEVHFSRFIFLIFIIWIDKHNQVKFLLYFRMHRRIVHYS